jgi:two-component system, sensor histidine kinase and response regulator
VPGGDWPAVPGDPDPRRFDRAALLERLGGDEMILTEIVRVFLEDAPGQFQAMQAAAASGDIGVLRRLAHTMKGAAGTVGATRLQDAALALEQAVVAGDTAASGLLAALGEHLSEAQREMTSWLGGEKRA